MNWPERKACIITTTGTVHTQQTRDTVMHLLSQETEWIIVTPDGGNVETAIRRDAIVRVA